MSEAHFSKASSSVQDLEKKLCTTLDPTNTAEALVGMYDPWSVTFDKDKQQAVWKSYAVLAQEVAKVVPDKNVKILDIGAGTGLHAIELKRAGFMHIDALDPSSEMLQIAEEKQLYEKQIVDYVDKHKLDIEKDTYDVITGSGVYIPGHMTADGFDELRRINKPGGMIFIWLSQVYYGDEYNRYGDQVEAGIHKYIDQGLWKLKSRTLVPYHEKVYLYLLQNV